MGGDYADGINIDALRAYSTAYKGHIYNVMGNHEYMDYFAENGEMTPKTVNGATLWEYLNGDLTDAIVGSYQHNYYYVDNPTQKMRYIILNVYTDGSVADFDSTQQAWLSDVLANTPAEYTVIIFTHMSASVDHDTGAISPSNFGSIIWNIADSSQANIAAIIQGHTHFDGLGSTTGGIPVFITTCDKYSPYIANGVDQEPWLAETRTAYTITEQAFDVFVVDKKNRKVFAVRIGCPAYNPGGSPLEVRESTY